MPAKRGVTRQSAKNSWTVEFLDERVEAEFDEFSTELKADFVHIAEMIEQVGLQSVGHPHVAHVEGKIWEMRAEDAGKWGRELYCTQKEKRVVILRCFTKKTNKTLRREIDIAKDRIKYLRE